MKARTSKITAKLAATCIIAALLSTLNNAAIAQPSLTDIQMPHPGFEAGRNDMPPMPLFGHNPSPPFLQGIALTEIQHDKIFELMYAQEPSLREKMKTLHKTQHELHKQAFANTFDIKTAKKISITLAETIASIEILRTETDAKIYALLTDDQRQQLDKNMASAKLDMPRM